MENARAIAGIAAGRRTKWLVLVFWLVRGGGRRAAVREADGGGEERRPVVAAAQGGIHAGAEPTIAVRITQCLPGRGGV